MESERIDFESLEVFSADVLRSLPLNVGILQDDKDESSIMALFLSHTVSAWRPFPFETFEHAIEKLEREPFHVFVTHWHIGRDHGVDNRVTRLVQRLRKDRGTPGVGRGPLLVATYNFIHSDLFDKGPLGNTYDLCLPKPSSELTLEIVSRLFEMLPRRIRRGDHEAGAT